MMRKLKIKNKITPYYKNDFGELYHGKCEDIVPKLNLCVDMILCDPPYGTTQNKWDSIIPLDKMWSFIWKNSKANASIVMTASTPFDKILGCSCIKDLKYEWIWSKNKASGHLNAKKMPMKGHENILVFYKKLPTYNPQMTTGHKPMNYAINKNSSSNYGQQIPTVCNEGTTSRYPKTVQFFPVLNNDNKERFHPTQKPVELFEYLVKTYTNECELVLDFAAGSGTTAIACQNLNRKWIMVEKEKEYCDLIVERLLKYEKKH